MDKIHAWTLLGRFCSPVKGLGQSEDDHHVIAAAVFNTLTTNTLAADLTNALAIGARNRGADIYRQTPVTGATQNLGPLFPSTSPFSYHHGEGWYFSATRPHALYINDGVRLIRYDVVSKATETVFDVREHLGSDKRIWQAHSSNDDRVHSATVKDGSYKDVGCVAYNQSTGRSDEQAVSTAFTASC